MVIFHSPRSISTLICGYKNILLQAIMILYSYSLNALSLSQEISCQKQLTNYSAKKVLQFSRRDAVENSFI